MTGAFLFPSGGASGDTNSINIDPSNRLHLAHIAFMLMMMDRPDPNSNVQCEPLRDRTHDQISGRG